MAYLPGAQGIIEDCLFVFALAHTYHVSAVAKNQLQLFQYVRKDIQENADRLLIERLLSLAVKVRFLDDQTDVLRSFDRKLRTIGEYSVNGKDAAAELSVRLALNKVIHHRKISIATEDRSAIVVAAGPETGDLKIPEGRYKESYVRVRIEGELGQDLWVLDLDLFVLLNDILRVLYLQQSNPLLNTDAQQ